MNLSSNKDAFTLFRLLLIFGNVHYWFLEMCIKLFTYTQTWYFLLSIPNIDDDTRKRNLTKWRKALLVVSEVYRGQKQIWLNNYLVVWGRTIKIILIWLLLNIIFRLKENDWQIERKWLNKRNCNWKNTIYFQKRI